MNLDFIQPHHGVGSLRFGMTDSAVIQLLGAPSDEFEDEDGDVQLSWEGLQLECTFFLESELQLGVVATERESARLVDRLLLGESKDQVRGFMATELGAAISEEDGCIHEDGTHQEWIDVDDLGLLFWFHDNVLYAIDCSCAWQDDETPKWPNESRAQSAGPEPE